jgi:DNA-directed RNA polymerase specialized sigma24 family protein
MNKDRLLILAAQSKMLQNLCAKLCNYRDIHNDLFQEFLLYLCKKDDDFLIKKYNDIQFISYCSNVIKGLNSDRHRANKLINTKNPLVERHTDIEFDFDITDESYNFEIDMKFDRVVKFTRNEPFKADILFKSVVSSTREIAQELGVNQRRLIYENNKFKTEIKNNIK